MQARAPTELEQRLQALANMSASELSAYAASSSSLSSPNWNAPRASSYDYSGAAVNGKRGRSEDSRPQEPVQKKSRWSPAEGGRSFIPGIPLLIPPNLPRDVLDALLIRIRIEEITQNLTTGQLGLDEECRRSPSPPPTYDSSGKRTNTREQRTKEKLGLERQELIHAALQLNPLFKPPADYKPISVKKNRKIKIPVDKYPDYNFIGLIIGPRGDTHKQMERESGAKISIRGKGSQKEGQKNKHNPDDEEELHVLVTGDTQESVDKAAVMIEKLLVPIDDDKNEHKQLQLRKLADYNGTLRETSWNSRDGIGGAGTGFRRFGAGQEIACAFCGEPSHPTSDCPVRGKPGAKSKLDKEYESFLAAIGEAPSPPTSSATSSATSPYGQQQSPAARPPSGSPYGGGGGGPPAGPGYGGSYTMYGGGGSYAPPAAPSASATDAYAEFMASISSIAPSSTPAPMQPPGAGPPPPPPPGAAGPYFMRGPPGPPGAAPWGGMQ